MSASPAKLSLADRLLNLSILAHSLLISPWAMLRFLWRINRHRGPRVGNGFRWPRTVRVDTLPSGVPGGLLAEWEQYGIPAALLPGSFVRVAGSRKERVCSFWVSPDQRWIADRHARQRWLVVSGSVWCPRRGSSAIDAQRGSWRASGNEPKARGLGEWSIRALGNLTGIRRGYVNRVRNEPGLRTGSPKRRKK